MRTVVSSLISPYPVSYHIDAPNGRGTEKFVFVFPGRKKKELFVRNRGVDETVIARAPLDTVESRDTTRSRRTVRSVDTPTTHVPPARAAKRRAREKKSLN